MSELIRILNSIKIHRTGAWLTPSQRNVQEAIKELLRVPQTINLCGPAGSGKTFLAWHLADELGYVYLPHPGHLVYTESLGSEGLIIDNCRPDRRAHRDILRILQLNSVLRAIFITRQIIQDYTRYVELKLTFSDQSKVCENLSTVGLFREPDARNLWYLVNPYLLSLGAQAQSGQPDDLLQSKAE